MKFITVIFLLIFALPLHAQNLAVEDILVDNCKLSLNLIDRVKEYLDDINVMKNTNNNLARKTGSPEQALGKKIIIKGRVLDANCLPIENVEVKIWHRNTNGVFNVDALEKPEFADDNFIDSGITRTDNLGYFEFFTIYPKAAGNREPFVNFLIKNSGMEPFVTLMYFPDNKNNHLDEKYYKLNYPEREKVTAKIYPQEISSSSNQAIYYFDVVLPKPQKFKRY